MTTSPMAPEDELDAETLSKEALLREFNRGQAAQALTPNGVPLRCLSADDSSIRELKQPFNTTSHSVPTTPSSAYGSRPKLKLAGNRRGSMSDRIGAFENTMKRDGDDCSFSSYYEEGSSPSATLSEPLYSAASPRLPTPRRRGARPSLAGRIQDYLNSPGAATSSAAGRQRFKDSILASPQEGRQLLDTNPSRDSKLHISDRVSQYEEKIHELTAKLPFSNFRKESAKDRCRNAPSKKTFEEKRKRSSTNGNQRRGNETKKLIWNEVRAAPLDFSNFIPPVYNELEKTDSQESLIKNTVDINFVFEELKTNDAAHAKQTVRTLIQAFEAIEVKAGGVILQQGEDKQEGHFYIIEQGRVDFQVDGVTVGSANKGDCFGEQALLYLSAPNVTAVAAMPDEDDDRNVGKKAASFTRLLRLDQTSFRGIFHSYAIQSNLEKRQLIQGVDFLQDLLKEEKILIGSLTSIMTRHEFKRDEKIEAHPDDTFYIVQDGTLLVTGGDMDNVTLASGDYLGEQALMGAFSNHGASKTTMTGMFKSGSYYTIDRATMEKVLGPSRLRRLKDMLKLVRRDRNIIRRASCFFDITTHHIFCAGYKRRMFRL
jgi:CRP-like cAMP-binding protein